ncbi:5-oxoprolinase [Geodia barretti]|uniref:5-oxoprolinase n=1 Tax=Geodia barretti TaxID=519541 RepID=A0AA35SCT8_GEOBA|nr:5-oxoprolinase [Geodia barretti]
MFRFSIDRGGTFTDVYAECPSGKVRALKLLSDDPRNYKDAPTEAIRRILEEEFLYHIRGSPGHATARPTAEHHYGAT